MPRKQVTCRREHLRAARGIESTSTTLPASVEPFGLGNRDGATAETWRGHVEHLAQSTIDQSARALRQPSGSTHCRIVNVKSLSRSLGCRITYEAKAVAKKSEIPLTLKAFINHYIDARNVKYATQVSGSRSATPSLNISVPTAQSNRSTLLTRKCGEIRLHARGTYARERNARTKKAS